MPVRSRQILTLPGNFTKSDEKVLRDFNDCTIVLRKSQVRKGQWLKELVVVSGKGGTGKTSILAAFASLAKRKVLCDADVDAADLHVIMNPQIRERHDFESGP